MISTQNHNIIEGQMVSETDVFKSIIQYYFKANLTQLPEVVATITERRNSTTGLNLRQRYDQLSKEYQRLHKLANKETNC